MHEFILFITDSKQSFHLVLTMSRIISIGTAVPEYGTSQNNILDFMHAAYNDETASRKLKILFHHSGINTRYSVVPDFDNRKSGNNLLFENQNIPNVEKRLDVFKENAVFPMEGRPAITIKSDF